MSAKLYVRGCVTNGLGGALLYGIGAGLGVERAVVVAAALQLAVYLLHGLPFRSEKFYDLSGSATHLAVVLGCALELKPRSPRQQLLSFCSVVWAVRLGSFLFLRISKDGKDGRFDHIRPNWFAFLGAWTLQACWVSLTQLPVVLVNLRDDGVGFGPADAALFLLWLAGFGLEALADNQKSVFRADPANRKKFITTGLWAYSRHPNYCGEILMWAALAGVATRVAVATQDWTLLGAWFSPLFTATLLLKVSGVPMVEQRGEEQWGDDPTYRHYMSRTSKLLPWFPAGPFEEGAKDTPLVGA